MTTLSRYSFYSFCGMTDPPTASGQILRPLPSCSTEEFPPLRSGRGTNKVENVNKLVQATLANRVNPTLAQNILMQYNFHHNIQAGKSSLQA